MAHTVTEIQEYVATLRARAKESQSEAGRTLNPLFTGDEQGRAPGDFEPSSFLYIRSCDADVGERPLPCPAFWLSPDLRVSPRTNVGMATRELIAGQTYRFTAVVRNRGDLAVPSAKVEFYLANPTLGWDTRLATKLGVAAERVEAHGATEVSVDHTLDPALSGHRCLFARVFSFSPLDVPIADYALDPVVERQVAQLNLNIVGQASTFALDWVHLRNAAEALEFAPMTAQEIRPLRVEALTDLTLLDDGRWKEVQQRLELKFEAEDGADVDAQRTEGGLELVSQDRDALPIERQQELTDAVVKALQTMQSGRGDAAEFRELFKEYRAMTGETIRSRLTIGLPDLGLKDGEAVGVNVIKRSLPTGRPTGGIGLFVAAEDQ